MTNTINTKNNRKIKTCDMRCLNNKPCNIPEDEAPCVEYILRGKGLPNNKCKLNMLINKH